MCRTSAFWYLVQARKVLPHLPTSSGHKSTSALFRSPSPPRLSLAACFNPLVTRSGLLSSHITGSLGRGLKELLGHSLVAKHSLCPCVRSANGPGWSFCPMEVVPFVRWRQQSEPGWEGLQGWFISWLCGITDAGRRGSRAFARGGAGRFLCCLCSSLCLHSRIYHTSGFLRSPHL